MSSKNMINNRKVLISNLPNGVTSNEIIQELFKSQNFKYSSIDFDGSSAIVTLANANEAKRAAKLINGQLFKGLRISVIEAPPPETFTPSSGGSNYILVGNLSFDFTEDQFKDLMSPHGEIKSVFLVRGKISKKSKGYGFIEYKYKESASKAKDHFIKTDAKFVDGRIIRVETVSPSLATGEAKHSRSLFVDKLPKSFEDDEQLTNLFSSVGKVTFCKVARNKQGQPRGYALIDYATVTEAEKGQEKLDGTQIGESNIRISFCTPGKTAQEIFAKFDDSNNRQSGGGQGKAGSHGPRMPTLMAGNASPLAGGFGARTAFPQPGPLRTPYSIGTIPGMQRLPIPTLRPRVPLLGPTPIGVPVSFSGPPLRIPRLRAPDVRTLHPGIKPGQGVRKIRPNSNKSALVTLKPRANATKTTPGKGNELAKKVKEEVNKMVDEAKKNNQNDQKATKETKEAKETANESAKGKRVQPKEEAKPKTSPADSLDSVQKVGENAVAAATSQSSEDGGKDLKPVVFMDSEQLKQFQQFQELMKKQKEAEKSGDSTAVSLEDLVAAAKGMKEAESQKALGQTIKSESGKPSVEPKQPQAPQKAVKQEQGVSKQTPQKPEQSKSVAAKSSNVVSKSSPAQAKPLPASNKSSTVSGKSSSTAAKLSPAATKPSPAATKPSPATTKPSPATTKPSPMPAKPSPATIKPVSIKLSPAIANSSSIPARHSPVVSKASPDVSKSSTAWKSPATSKPSSTPQVSKSNTTWKSPATSKPLSTSEVSKSGSTWKSPATSKPSSAPEDSKPNTAWKKPSSTPEVSKSSSTWKSSATSKPSSAAEVSKPNTTWKKPSSTPEVSKSGSTWKSPATNKQSSTADVSKSNTAWKSPATSKPSVPEVTKSNTAWKAPATSKPSSAPTRSAPLKQETQKPWQRQEKSTTSSGNSYQRPSQYQQKSRVEEQRSIKNVGSYERERKQNDRNSYHDSKPVNTTSRSGSSSSAPMQPPPKPPLAANLLQKLFGTKLTNEQDYGSDQRAATSQDDSRSPYGNSYQSGGKSSLSAGEVSRGSPKSSQQSQYAYNQQYQSTDGRNYESKRSPAPERESPGAQSSLRSRYTLPERLPHARGNGEPTHTSPPRYERQQERELISYPRPRSDFPPRNDPPSARDINPPYGTPPSRGPIEPRDSQRDMRSSRDPIGTRNLASLRDILPPRDDSPSSRDALLPRDRSSRDYLPRDLPPRDVSPRGVPPRDIPPRDIPPRDMPRQRDSFSPRDSLPQRDLPPRDLPPRDLPPRDLPPRDMLPPRGLPPRDDRSGRDPYMREIEIPREREPMRYNDSPSRYQSSAPSREALDRARFERAITGARDTRSDYPAYGREPEPRYGRDLPSRESAMGTVRGPPTRYPLEGPQSKRPRY